MKRTTGLNVRGSFETNFIGSDFDPGINVNNYQWYNKLWYPEDTVREISHDEIHIITNLVITKNQSLSTCVNNLRCSFVSPNYWEKDCRPGHTRSALVS